MSLLQNFIEIVKRLVIMQKYNEIRSFDRKIVETFFFFFPLLKPQKYYIIAACTAPLLEIRRTERGLRSLDQNPELLYIFARLRRKTNEKTQCRHFRLRHRRRRGLSDPHPKPGSDRRKDRRVHRCGKGAGPQET